jgi:hypothetical protein
MRQFCIKEILFFLTFAVEKKKFILDLKDGKAENHIQE